MTTWSRLAPLFGVACALFATPTRADSIRCGDRFASTGATLYEVKSLCGVPDDAQRRTEYRTVQQRVGGPCGPGRVRCGTIVERTIEVSIDEWTYDFGRRRFVQHLVFEEGRLLVVRNGDYGQKDD
jgi:Protein of unknown function (DUF2845)